MNIHYTSYGKGQPVVFFHGWGFDSQIWHSLIPFLEEQYQLILVDLPGFGLTPLMPWDLFKTRLLEILPAQFAVVGWSLGGLYATRLAIEAPVRITSLLNIASSPRFVADSLWPAVSKDVFSHFYQNLTVNIQGTLNDFIALQLSKTKHQFNLGIPPLPSGLESGLMTLDTWDLRDGLVQLDMPTCFMFGRLDPITPIKLMHAMEELYPQFKYILFNRAAHMPFLSHTDLFIKEFTGFIK